MEKHYPFLLKKEENFIIQEAPKANKPDNSLSNFNIIEKSSYINIDSNRKNKNIELKREGAIRSSSLNPGAKFSVGRWTKEEHIKFLKGLIEYGCDWNMVHEIVKTRSRAQARSHAQKYFVKMIKIIKSKIMQYNLENLLICTFNLIKNFNGGQPMTVNQKKRILNIIISNFQGIEKEEVKRCNILVNDTKNVYSQEDGDKSAFVDKKLIVPEKNNIIIENNYLKNNYILEDNKNIQENKIEFCNKKRKNSSFANKIFQINKVMKYKHSNNFNKIDELSNEKKIFANPKNSKIKKKINSENKFNINCHIIKKSNINNCNTSCNNNINDFISINKNNFNFSESLFNFCSSIKNMDDKFLDRNEFNDSFKSINFEESNSSNLSIGEQDNISSIFKSFDLFEFNE